MHADTGRGGGITRITIDSDPLAVRQALAQLFDSLLLRSLGEDDRGAAEIVLAEVLNNIVEHAYANSHGEIELALELGPGRLTCQITDRGAPMPDGTLSADPAPPPETSLPEGGFGWSLIRTLAHDLEYRRANGVNRLRFRIDSAPASACGDAGHPGDGLPCRADSAPASACGDPGRPGEGLPCRADSAPALACGDPGRPGEGLPCRADSAPAAACGDAGHPGKGLPCRADSALAAAETAFPPESGCESAEQHSDDDIVAG